LGFDQSDFVKKNILIFSKINAKIIDIRNPYYQKSKFLCRGSTGLITILNPNIIENLKIHLYRYKNGLINILNPDSNRKSKYFLLEA